jgi:hypothetical protein
MIAPEHAGFDAIEMGYFGQGTVSYASVIVVDGGDGPPIPGAVLVVRYGGQTFGGNTNDNGTSVIALPAPAGTSVDVSASYPGYDAGSMSVTTSADPNASPMGIPIYKSSTPAPAPVVAPRPGPIPVTATRAPFATPYTPRPIVAPPRPGMTAAVSTTSNLPLYLALGGVGLAALIVVVLIARS